MDCSQCGAVTTAPIHTDYGHPEWHRFKGPIADEVTSLKTENARYRAALEKIAADYKADSFFGGWFRKVAEKALSPEAPHD